MDSMIDKMMRDKWVWLVVMLFNMKMMVGLQGYGEVIVVNIKNGRHAQHSKSKTLYVLLHKHHLILRYEKKIVIIFPKRMQTLSIVCG